MSAAARRRYLVLTGARLHPVAVNTLASLILTGVLLGVGGCGATDDRSAGDAGGIIPAAHRTAPDVLRGTTLTGDEFDSSALGGSVVVYNVWGSWCPPCRAEAPTLKQVSEESRALGVRFVGIDTRDTRAAALAFERRFGIGYSSVFDPDGELLLSFRGLVPPSAIPSTIVVDRSGRIAARIIGATTYLALTTLLKHLASE